MFSKWGLFSLGILLSSSTFAEPPSSESIRFMIKFKKNHQQLIQIKKQLSALTQATITDVQPMANNAFTIQVKPSNPARIKNRTLSTSILQKLRAQPDILYALPDRIGYIKPVANPSAPEMVYPLPSHNIQWDEFLPPGGILLETKPGLRDGAWSFTTGYKPEPIVIAVLDTGVALHPALVANLVQDNEGTILGWNFANNNSNILDETHSYHGTHVAGTIAGYSNEMIGVGEHLKVLPIKIPDASGMFYESAVINAIYWAVGAEVPGVPHNRYPAKVLNMSFSIDIGPGEELEACDSLLQEAVTFARDKGAVLAVAAGNSNELEHFNAPAVCEGTLKIAATGPTGLRSYYSNYGPTISFAAPGGDKRFGELGGILSAVHPNGGVQHSGYDFYQGTSMATPHVAGVAGLIFAVAEHPLQAAEVEELLTKTTHDFGESTNPYNSCVGDIPCGHGILDAQNAVKATLAHYDVLFSAPKFADMAAAPCGNSISLATNDTLVFKNSSWKKITKGCQNLNDYQHPRIVQNADGTIDAIYGVVRYRLQTARYKFCEVIGFDGVGCQN